MRGQRVTDNGMAKKFTKPPTISEKEARVFEGGFSEHRLMKKAPGSSGSFELSCARCYELHLGGIIHHVVIVWYEFCVDQIDESIFRTFGRVDRVVIVVK